MWTWTPLPIWMRQWSDRGSKEIPSLFLYIYIPRTHVTHVICLGGWTFHLMGRILQKTDHFASRYIFLLYIFYIPEHAKPSLFAIVAKSWLANTIEVVSARKEHSNNHFGKRSLGPSHWWKKHCTSWRMMVLPLSHVLRKFWYVHGGLPNFWTINSMPFKWVVFRATCPYISLFWPWDDLFWTEPYSVMSETSMRTWGHLQIALKWLLFVGKRLGCKQESLVVSSWLTKWKASLNKLSFFLSDLFNTCQSNCHLIIFDWHQLMHAKIPCKSGTKSCQ